MVRKIVNLSSSLKLLIEKQKKEQYKKAMLEASEDRLFMSDMKELEDAFFHADNEKMD